MNTDDYIGRPYISGGDGPDGYDCYGLARAIAADRGFVLPAQRSVDGVALREAVFDRRLCQWTEPIDRPEPWSLIVFDHKSLGLHVGTIIDVPGKFIHVSQLSGSVRIDRIRNRLFKRPYGYHRLTYPDRIAAAAS